MAVYTLFLVAPVVQASFYSFFAWNGFGAPDQYLGTANYEGVLSDRLFWKAFVNNLILIAFMFVTILPIAFGLAVLISDRIRFAVAFRLIYFLLRPGRDYGWPNLAISTRRQLWFGGRDYPRFICVG